MPEGFHARVANQLRAQSEMPEGEGVWFCVPCEDANVTRSDEDRCCLMCGIDLVSLGQLRALLATQGLHIVNAKDRAALAEVNRIVTDTEGGGGCRDRGGRA
jgi:hypothetical protein